MRKDILGMKLDNLVRNICLNFFECQFEKNYTNTPIYNHVASNER